MSSSFLQDFKQVIAMCLLKDPSGRPSAQKLLKHSFFKHAKSHSRIIKDVLDKLPSLVDRFHSLKVHKTLFKTKTSFWIFARKIHKTITSFSLSQNLQNALVIVVFLKITQN